MIQPIMKVGDSSRKGSVIVALVFLFLTSSDHAAQVLHDHVPAVVASLRSLGRFPGTNYLNLAIGLPLRNQAVLSNLLQQIYDPTSPNYHHYLTSEQFSAQFGPTEQDYQAVINFASTNGFTVVGTCSNRTLVDVGGKVADIERAFHVQMRTYQHPSEKRQFYAPDVEPTVDANLPILSIYGLNNYVLARPLYHVKSSQDYSPDDFSTGSSPSGSYWGYDFRKAYAPGVTLTGTGQTVALFECDGYYNNDVSSYLTATGLPGVALTNVLIDGFGGLPSGSGGEVEVALDIDMAISMAPGLSKIIIYEGPSDTPAYTLDILNRIATDNLAKQISSSWLIDDTAQFAQIYQQFAIQGQSFFQASGDEGAYYPGIFQYEDSPLVTLVGGTTLISTGAGGVWASETVWSGSGGGISTTYSIPSWQTNINMTANQGSTTMRNIPDVALTANNIYIWGDGSPITSIGGTSCAAPLWAGFMALVNQQLAANGGSPIGFLNPTIYSLGQSANYTNLFHDITTGNNTSGSSPTKFYAVAGYDLCTGWGTPAGQNLINALAPLVVVTLPPSATEGDGLLPGAGQIQLPTVQTSNVVIGLTSSDPAQVQVPASITLFAGQSNAVFDLTILDDGVLDGTQTATITASVPSSGTGSASMNIFDKETAVLQVSLPATVTKGQGTVQGIVQVSAPVGANVTVGLSSSSTNLIQVPASVMVPSGQTSAVFTATILTDGQINGGQIVNVTAHVQNWTDGTAAVTVQDNLNLTVTLPASVWKNAGVLTNGGSVSTFGALPSNLPVTLSSGSPAVLIVPSTLTISAGTASSTFNITVVDNSTTGSNQTVTVTASAPGFTNGSASMLLLNDQSPAPPSNPQPGNLATNVSASTNLTWNNGSNSTNNSQLILNGGFEAGSLTNWTLVPSAYGTFVINNGMNKPYSPDPALPPYAGSYSALGDEYGPGIFYMYQTISIPTNATSATLNWAHRVRNFYSSFGPNQQFQVRICDTNNNVLVTPFTTNPGDTLLGNWVQTNYNLTSFAGKQVRVMFWVNPGGYYLDVHVDSVSVQVNTASVTNSPGILSNDVYFGTNSTPGPNQFQGSTTNASWNLPLLSPQTTYYWQIVAHQGGTTTGPVWQFTTAAVDHFVWNTIASPQYVNQPFTVTVTANDAFNRTVSNFTSRVSLLAIAGGGNSMIEDFESGIWPHSPWVSVAGVTLGTISPAYAHDGNYGLSDPDWIYRTDVSLGRAGDFLSWWIRPGTGRAYLGFGASAGGCWSVVVEPNTGQFGIQQNSGYNFTGVATNNQTWQAGKWYKVAVQFVSTSSVTCKLYDSDGTTLLNSLSYASVTGLPGGVAMRSFGGFSLDTVTSGAGTGAVIPMSPTNSGNFINGTWSGNVTVQQPATNVVLQANDGNGHTGSSNPFNAVQGTPPFITNQPASQRISIGCNAVFSVGAGGTGPLCCQWWKGGSVLNGQTNSILTLTNVQVTDFTNYYAVVTNGFGSVTSSNAVLSQNHPPVAVQDIIQRLATSDVKVQVSMLMSNDTDPDGDALTFLGVSTNSAAGGTVYWTGNWVYYLPPAGYTNSDAFAYIISDGYCGGTATGNVLVQVVTASGPSHNFRIYAQPDGSVLLVFAGIPGWTYRIQYADTLPPVNWTDLSTNTADAQGFYQFIDVRPTDAPSRFYRSVSP